MAKKIQKKKPVAKPAAPPKPKDFLDMIAPSAVKFNTDCSIIGGAYHTFLSLRGYAASTEDLARSKIAPDPLLLRQREGFQSANPAGFNAFGSQFERVLPAGSVANLYFFNYSGKTDPLGFYVGRDRYGSNVIVDLDRRAEDKTTASVLILGNSGQGKSYC